MTAKMSALLLKWHSWKRQNQNIIFSAKLKINFAKLKILFNDVVKELRSAMYVYSIYLYADNNANNNNNNNTINQQDLCEIYSSTGANYGSCNL